MYLNERMRLLKQEKLRKVKFLTYRNRLFGDENLLSVQNFRVLAVSRSELVIAFHMVHL
jgi:hypothetical protein